jgi:hypothetical protein
MWKDYQPNRADAMAEKYGAPVYLINQPPISFELETSTRVRWILRARDIILRAPSNDCYSTQLA